MRRTRAQYHYAIRAVKRDENKIVRQRFAQAVLGDSSRDLWKEVRKINGKKAVSARIIDGNGHPQGIAQRFADKYQDLYNSVSFNVKGMEDIKKSVIDKVSEAGYSADYVITAGEVV